MRGQRRVPERPPSRCDQMSTEEERRPLGAHTGGALPTGKHTSAHETGVMGDFSPEYAADDEKGLGGRTRC